MNCQGLAYYPSTSVGGAFVGSSFTANANTWNDMPAAGFGTSYTDPIGPWDIPAGGDYVFTNTNGHEKIFPIDDLGPGSIVEGIRVKILGGNALDGVKMEFVKRAAGAATWTSVSSNNLTSDVLVTGGPTSITATTIVANTDYAIRVTSIVAVKDVKLFSVGYYTTKRVFK